MNQSTAEELAQIERDIEDHKFAEKVDLARAGRERSTWTPEQRSEFAAARESATRHLLELVAIRDELKRKLK